MKIELDIPDEVMASYAEYHGRTDSDPLSVKEFCTNRLLQEIKGTYFNFEGDKAANLARITAISEAKTVVDNI